MTDEKLKALEVAKNEVDDIQKDPLKIRFDYPFSTLLTSEVAKVNMDVCCDNSGISYGGAADKIASLEQEIVKLKQERDAYIAFLNEMIFRPIRNFAKRNDTHYIATCIAEGIKNGTINCEGSVQEVWLDYMPGKIDPYYIIQANYVLRTKK